MGKIQIFIGALLLVFLGSCSPSEGAVNTFNDTRQCVVKSFTSQIGVMELTGHNDGVKVTEYLASTRLPQGYEWCAAFCNWNLKQCGVKTINNAWADAWFPPSKTIYTRSTGLKRIPQAGDVIGYYFTRQPYITHVGLVDRWTDKYVWTVEGNTYDPPGYRHGVYRKIRHVRTVGKVSDWIS